MSALDRILDGFRNAAVTEREKGTYFERLALAYLRNDPIQTQQFSEVWTYGDWAKENGWTGKDTGIDLVAKLADEDGYAAVQCKFYAANKKIQIGDIQTFITASGKAPFSQRLFIDTTEVDWGENAEDAIRGQSIPVVRVGLDALRDSAIDWSVYEASDKVQLRNKKQLHSHQKLALEHVGKGFEQGDRGKLIMACGTGKTFTALRIAEAVAGKGKRVLFLVPSLALIAQTVREWTYDTELELRSFAVCSDAQVGKRRKDRDDVAEIEVHELEFPATTQPEKLVEKAGVDDTERMTVVFSTYQSIPVITAAQEQGLQEFDLVICDEAHRTTGATIDGEDESNFVRVHDNKYVAGAKRLYMTATPRIFGDNARTKAAEAAVTLCDMDDEEIYGPTFFTRGFSWAVENGMLTDYKVIVLAMDETLVSRGVQGRIAADNELQLDDATKIIGCYKALIKQGGDDDFAVDAQPMRRAIAFCKDIRSSKLIEREFGAVVDEFNGTTVLDDEDAEHISCEVKHVDGTFNAKTRGELLHWLSDDVANDSCKILSNARCLSEGVDVPALDAIMFLHPRKSQIDVVQSVGRVMRRAEGKKLGYVILPVVIPANVTPEAALNDNERYKVVWQILNALRAHDDRFDATINKLELNNDTGGQIEVVAIAENLPQKQTAGSEGAGIGGEGGDDGERDTQTRTDDQISFIFDEFPAAIRAKIVQKCGRRTYWEDWAKDIGKIAQQHIERINAILDTGVEERAVFDAFLEEIRDDLNGAVTEDEAVEMLAQHLITKPVFDALFSDYNFAGQNPVSQAMQKVVAVLEPKNIQKEAQALEGFYDSVKRRAAGIDNAEGKQKIIVELYDKFFKTAFPKLTEKLGIVYTPVQVVDFIIHSVNDILQQEFNETLGSKNVHIIDPFTGTGTFVTRLLQSGLIDAADLEYKYKNEIHANEIVLLAYYIAAINIEATYHSISGNDYTPFTGICLTDTFEMYESDDMVAALMADNSERRTRQKALDIRVIVGNPPYNVADTGVEYKDLNARIAETYAARTNSTLKGSLYDSYIKAIRWASDRIGDSGVIGFVTNGGWIDGNAMGGMRQCLEEEFSSIYVFNLRGNARTSGEQRRKESGNAFGEGSRAPVAVSFLVKNPNAKEHGKIYYNDIGDYLTREQKLAKVAAYKSIKGMAEAEAWELVKADEFGDWINKRDLSFNRHLLIGDKSKGNGEKLFAEYSNGVQTAADAWLYNSSNSVVSENLNGMVKEYSKRLAEYKDQQTQTSVKEFVGDGSNKLSWHDGLYAKLDRFDEHDGVITKSIQSDYRPFTPQYLGNDKFFLQRSGKMEEIFCGGQVDNLAIGVTGVGAKSFSCLIVSRVISRDQLQKGQFFPLKIYEKYEVTEGESDLFAGDGASNGYAVKDGITDYGLKHFRDAYSNASITKEDIFYYTYGLLHSEDYRTRYADNLSKQLPRIPAVKKEADFWTFVEAGRKLGDLHVNYESAELYPVTIAEGDLRLANIDDPVSFYRVEQMRYAGKRGSDKTTLHYNNNITMTDIPLAAYDYVVNGKSALDWVVERQRVKTDPKSGIVNDANDYANETMNNPAYPLELFQRVITVSLETMKIVNSLPKLELE
ncbi:DEAD/DEAH box helicase [Sulfitobacter mediterraneus]|uniref:Putative helicase n=1 Tax=Sulfitobacter mediterraneus TaxID=83219 RepID=A0A2T6CHC5_9RHOB|nr:type ISP restriction/modification enzyme [Sulfitobacter mediterraneus]KIN77213.1 Type III restriction protein res subunit [Sulfitobacter mediterraneus KCTC 32188]PTX74898.1 putative helicase [Sulfitobacter mediterraneus]